MTPDRLADPVARAQIDFLRSPALRWMVAITIACRTYYCLRLVRTRTALISFRGRHFQSSRGNSFRWAHISGGVFVNQLDRHVTTKSLLPAAKLK